jgi:tRNA(adenine34) deaminase
MNIMTHESYMREALTEARRAFENDEVPIGCVIVRGGEIIARAANERNTRKNALAHAEIDAINQACAVVGDWRLEDCILYVTVEPCPMCAGAILQARIPTVVYGAANPKAGCAGSILNILDEPRFNHQPNVIGGVLAEECGALMSGFFVRFRSTCEI